MVWCWAFIVSGRIRTILFMTVDILKDLVVVRDTSGIHAQTKLKFIVSIQKEKSSRTTFGMLWFMNIEI